MNYNYGKFSSDKYNLDGFDGPDVGEQAPDFPLNSSTGDNVNLLDFSGDYLVLELGSISCPLFQGRRDGMESLISAFPNVSFSILYVREAHPGSKIPAHLSEDDKRSCALKLSVDGEKRNILVDDLEGTAHSAYGGYPNALFIIDREHNIVFRSDWNNVSATRKALEKLTSGQPAIVKSYFLPVKISVAIKTLRDSGEGALPDFFKSLPKLIWKNVFRRNFLLFIGAKK